MFEAVEALKQAECCAAKAGNLVYLHEVDNGGHFAAWEQPELFAAGLRGAFRSLRPAH